MPKKANKKIEEETFKEEDLLKEKNAGVRMKICEVCGEQRLDVIPCRMCGIHFCGECGYIENHLCFSCGDEAEETQEDVADENLTESSEPEPEE